MKNLILGLSLVFSTSQVFALENTIEFVEMFRSKSCETSKTQAKERVAKQVQSGTDVYSGSIKYYHGKKVIRFIQKIAGCNPIWSEAEGMLYDYHLTVQIDGN